MTHLTWDNMDFEKAPNTLEKIVACAPNLKVLSLSIDAIITLNLSHQHDLEELHLEGGWSIQRDPEKPGGSEKPFYHLRHLTLFITKHSLPKKEEDTEKSLAHLLRLAPNLERLDLAKQKDVETEDILSVIRGANLGQLTNLTMIGDDREEQYALRPEEYTPLTLSEESRTFPQAPKLARFSVEGFDVSTNPLDGASKGPEGLSRKSDAKESADKDGGADRHGQGDTHVESEAAAESFDKEEGDQAADDQKKDGTTS